MLAKAVVIAAAVGMGAATYVVGQAPSRSVWDGVYTEEQARRGAALYEAECAECHGSGGSGGSMAPDLTGAAFSANYDGQTVGALFERNRLTMPVGREGRLSREAVADITAYLLQVNKFPAGKTELPSGTQELSQIRYLAVRPEKQSVILRPGGSGIRRGLTPGRAPGAR